MLFKKVKYRVEFVFNPGKPLEKIITIGIVRSENAAIKMHAQYIADNVFQRPWDYQPGDVLRVVQLPSGIVMFDVEIGMKPIPCDSNVLV